MIKLLKAGDLAESRLIQEFRRSVSGITTIGVDNQAAKS
jgi:hypothetical protein